MYLFVTVDCLESHDSEASHAVSNLLKGAQGGEDTGVRPADWHELSQARVPQSFLMQSLP
jgi:hypothetical protein